MTWPIPMTNWKGLPRVRELSNTLPLGSYALCQCHWSTYSTSVVHGQHITLLREVNTISLLKNLLIETLMNYAFSKRDTICLHEIKYDMKNGETAMPFLRHGSESLPIFRIFFLWNQAWMLSIPCQTIMNRLNDEARKQVQTTNWKCQKINTGKQNIEN